MRSYETSCGWCGLCCMHIICMSSARHPLGSRSSTCHPHGWQRPVMTSETTYDISTSYACHVHGLWCGPHWHKSSKHCSHCPRCGPHWQRLSYVIPTYTLHFVCASSLRSLGHLHIVPLVPRDWGWCWELHILLAYHLHVISVVSDVVCIDTDHPQAAFIVLDVVPIDRGHLQVVPVVPNAVPIDRSCCLHIISHLYGCLCGPWRLGMTLETTYVICMSSLWSPETWDYIRDHIGYYLCDPHVCMWSAHHLYTIYMSSSWSLETGHDIRHHIADDLYGPHVCTLSTHHFE